eukprot:TRINITY_DN2229_c0_g1_i7.p2 TRINITY_DN2229_c0_g1~~TRINITY_DN2229_c0_g1_i7.p2  ORF type:complete len:140 (+),score=17.97 TRINITY_DN2229_c0_g1_i7:177-596(+)
MVVQNFKDLKCLKRRELLEVYDDANFNHKLFETSWAVLSLEGRLYLWEQLVAPDHSGGGRRAPLAMVSTLLWCGGLVASPGQACCCTNRDPGKCIMALARGGTWEIWEVYTSMENFNFQVASSSVSQAADPGARGRGLF